MNTFNINITKLKFLSKPIFPDGLISGENEYIKEKYIQQHLDVIPTQQMYLLKLKPHDFIEINEKDPKKSIRRIFDLDQSYYTNFEKDHLIKFDKFLDEYNEKQKELKNYKSIVIIPKNLEGNIILRFLQSTCFNYTKTLEYLDNHIQWKKSFFPFRFDKHLSEILNSGFIYCFGRDKRFRPILVLSPKVYIANEKKYSFEQWLESIIYFMEYLIQNLLIPGQLENWIIITDLKDVSLLGMPSDMSKFLKVMQSNYRARLYINYLLGMNFVLRGIWALIRNLLDPETNKKIQILSSSEFNIILKQANPSQVEKKFGGNCENIVNNFFPPRKPESNEFLLKDDPELSTLLYNKDEYRAMLINGKLTCPSPYVIEEIKQELELEEARKRENERTLREAEEKRIQEEKRIKDEKIREFMAKIEAENRTHNKIINKEFNNKDKKYLTVNNNKISIKINISPSPFILQ